MDNMNDSQKIEELLHHFRMEQKEFAEKYGILPNTISNIKIGEHGISKKVFNQILKSFPEVNRNWLLDGEGEMLKKSQKIDNIRITKLDEDNQSGKLIPFYDDVRTIGGGGGNNMYDSGESTQTPTDYINTGGWFNNATGAIRHYGDSMIEYAPQITLLINHLQNKRTD